jgi:hypothetical protein
MKTWTKDEIKIKLESDDAWVIRGLMAIYKHQTDEERAHDVTKEQNGVGFNGVDATILSDMAKQYLRTKFLTKRQIEFIRKKMLKYAGQLAKIANHQV